METEDFPASIEARREHILRTFRAGSAGLKREALPQVAGCKFTASVEKVSGADASLIDKQSLPSSFHK